MNEKEITDQWKEYCPVYEAWGCFADFIYLKKDLWSIEHKRSSADDKHNTPNKFCYQSDHYSNKKIKK